MSYAEKLEEYGRYVTRVHRGSQTYYQIEHTYLGDHEMANVYTRANNVVLTQDFLRRGWDMLYEDRFVIPADGVTEEQFEYLVGVFDEFDSQTEDNYDVVPVLSLEEVMRLENLDVEVAVDKVLKQVAHKFDEKTLVELNRRLYSTADHDGVRAQVVSAEELLVSHA